MHSFTENWGDEVVLCLSGSITLYQEHSDGRLDCVMLEANEYAINPAGCWHTADIDAPATALFITAGLETQHRPR